MIAEGWLIRPEFQACPLRHRDLIAEVFELERLA